MPLSRYAVNIEFVKLNSVRRGCIDVFSLDILLECVLGVGGGKGAAKRVVVRLIKLTREILR